MSGKDKSPKSDSLRNSNNFDAKKKGFFNPTNEVVIPPSSKDLISKRNGNSPTGSTTNLPNSYISKYSNMQYSPTTQNIPNKSALNIPE